MTLFLRMTQRVLLGFISLFTFPMLALADAPHPKQLGFQEAATPVMRMMTEFHNLLLVIIISICIFVFILLAFVCWRFSAKRNPIPSKTTHNTMIEVVWTFIPIVILLVIAFPSIKLLYFMEVTPKSEMTLKITGYQWYWTYKYPDHGELEYEGRLIPDAELKPGQLRLLDTDTRVVLPINTKVKILVTAQDVIHSWAMPAFGIKKDAVPGRLNETWVEIEKEGVYHGQCSEICGKDHGFMPIVVQAVSKEKFEKWIKANEEAGQYIDINDPQFDTAESKAHSDSEAKPEAEQRDTTADIK